MIKDLQVTLYEVFGYLVPGMVNLAALAVLFWALFLPAQSVSFDIPSGEDWLVFLVLAYIAGHMAQAMGNLMEKQITPIEQLVIENAAPDKLPQTVIDACRAKIKELTGADMSSASARWLYRACDDAVIRSGKIGEREIYVYREGFYRGICVSFCIMTAACLVLCVRLCWMPEKHLLLAKAQWIVTQGQLMFFTLVSGIWTILAFRRYRRFGEYRTTHAFLGFLTVKETKKEGGV